MEFYIPIHSYTFHPFRMFWGKGFRKSIVFWLLFDPKNAAPWAAIFEIKQFTYVIIWDSKCGRCGAMGRSDSNRRGCTPHKTTLFLGTPSSLKSVHRSVTLLLVLSNHGLVFRLYYNRSGSLSRYYTHQDQ